MYQVSVSKDKSVSVEIIDGAFYLDGKMCDGNVEEIGKDEFSIIMNGKSYLLHLDNINYADKQITFLHNNARYTTTIKEPIDLLLSQMGINMTVANKVATIKAPMPGLIVKILVEEGDTIKKGDPVLILEAMKMENVFKAPSDAIIKTIKTTVGTAVEKGAVLIELA